MSTIWRSVGAAVAAVIFVLALGYLEVHKQSLELGLVLTWDLLPEQATPPDVAVLHRVLQFLLFGVVVTLFLLRRRGISGETGIPPLVGGLVLAGITIWSMATVQLGEVVSAVNETLEPHTWADVFEAGALSTATLGMTAVLLVIAVLRFTTPSPQSSRLR